ncbi:MAG: 50S ribosomal protein L25/general stress protein Ctc [Verrucomicrobiae bacterium]|nr:50S ribosomal protein L25/general stress protein Ctc [Verrucomicrobiae bacterium]
MASSVLLKASSRQVAGRNQVKKIRTQGRVPAVFYGKKTQATNLEIDSRALNALIQHATGENLVVDLELEQTGGSKVKKLALLQDVQHDPISGNILHVDLHEIAADEKIKAQVVVEATGEAVGVKTYGGILEHILRELQVECLPKDLPDRIAVDVSQLNVGQTLHVSDIVVPDGVQILNSKDLVVFSVAAPAVEEEKSTAEAAATPTQPEVIKEKKPAEGAAAESGDAKKDKK